MIARVRHAAFADLFFSGIMPQHQQLADVDAASSSAARV
jgi:hypothetical protein